MNNKPKIIAIDHGNRNIKTQNHVFPASFIERKYLPYMGGDTLKYKGKNWKYLEMMFKAN